jgi:DNA end-binding protein Ku
MSARSIWKGSIALGAFTFPVAAFSATNETNDTPLRQLHNECFTPINQFKACVPCIEAVQAKLANPKTKGEKRAGLEEKLKNLRALSTSDLIKGYEYEKGRFATFTDDELDAIKVDSSSAIVVDRFVDVASIDLMHYDRPYNMAPADPVALKAFALLRDSMQTRDVMAIGTICLYGRQHMVALRPSGKTITMQRLREQREIRDVAQVKFYDEIPAESNPVEVKMLSQIIDAMHGTFDPEMSEDPYRKELITVVQAKVNGTEYTAPAAKPTQSMADMMAALSATLDQAKAGNLAPKPKVKSVTEDKPAKPVAKKKAKVA